MSNVTSWNCGSPGIPARKEIAVKNRLLPLIGAVLLILGVIVAVTPSLVGMGGGTSSVLEYVVVDGTAKPPIIMSASGTRPTVTWVRQGVYELTFPAAVVPVVSSLQINLSPDTGQPGFAVIRTLQDPAKVQIESHGNFEGSHSHEPLDSRFGLVFRLRP